MTTSARAAIRVAALPAAIIGALFLLQSASAQFAPPSTVFGSISDSDGPIDAGLPVQAYIGETLCGTKGKTEFTGEGNSRVTVYVIDVVADSQTPGCGRERAGQQIRIKIGDRFAKQTATWDPGPVRLDLTFGNATPVAIPTFTPTPTRTPAPATNTPRPGETQAAVQTIPPGSPGAGSPVATAPLGGITSATPGAGRDGTGGDSGGGVPVWAVVLLVLGAVGVIGGGVGYMMSRSQRNQSEDDDFAPPHDDSTPFDG